jgi:hypothetical protein
VTIRPWVRRWAWVLALCLSWVAVGPVWASDRGKVAANQVSQASYQAFLRDWLYTHAGHNRGPSGAHHNLARDNILSLFQSYGLSAAFEPFTYGGYNGVNVVATKPGTVSPGQIYIIGGHYDSVSNPGADDNASGVAAVLETARILSQYPSDTTIRFIAFDLEELGLYGSKAYTTAHQNDDIRGMISLDMVCYDPDTNHALIYGRTASNPIKTALANALAEYSGGLTVTVGGQLDQSDHAPFEARGWQACLLIEGAVWANPYYHTQNDNYDMPGYLNFPYAVRMTRTVVGWLVDQAGVQVDGLLFTYPDGLPEYSFPNGATTVRVQVTGVGQAQPQPGTGQLHYFADGTWHAVPMASLGNNLYEATLPPATCGDDLLYYFSAETSTGQVWTDPFDAPDETHVAVVAYGEVVVYQNLLDTNPGWTTAGQWAFGRPTGGGSHNRDPVSGYTGNNVYGYNLAGDYTNNLPATYLTTTPINCAGRYNVKLYFWRWLGVESNNNYDEATVEVRNASTGWATIWRATATGAAISDSSWVLQSFDVSAYADNQTSFQIRWGMGPTDSSLTYPGWNIDDITLTANDCVGPPMGACCLAGQICRIKTPAQCADLGGLYEGDGTTCTPNPCLAPATCAGDTNCDGAVTYADIDAFIEALSGPAAWTHAPCPWLNADCDLDNDVTYSDIDAFVALIGTNCP